MEKSDILYIFSDIRQTKPERANSTSIADRPSTHANYHNILIEVFIPEKKSRKEITKANNSRFRYNIF